MTNHPIEYIEDGELTRMLEDKLFLETVYDEDGDYPLLLVQDIVELNGRKNFLVGVAAYLGKDPDSSADELLAEVKVRYKSKGVELTKTVKDWFLKEGRVPSTDQAKRSNLYDFCVAMGMDYRETARFFFKTFRTIPYNYKDRVDAIYFYCLKEKRPYDVIKQMLTLAKEFETTNTDVDSTEVIGLQILEIKTDEAFLEYLKKCCYDRKHQYATAREKLRELVAKNKRLVPSKNPIETEGMKEGRKTQTENSVQTETSVIELLKEILGYAYQELNGDQRELIEQCSLPTFPTEGDIGKILDLDKDVSFDILRKSLILMKFYNFYRDWHSSKLQPYMEEAEIEENFADFYDGMNTLLAECGFVQMYVRNPYDWIILYCARSSNPLEYLKDFIEKRYLDRAD